MSLFSRLFSHRAAEPAWIDVAELQGRLASGDVLLVDVRQPEEFIAPPGHLPGAINVPLGTLAGRMGELAARGSRSCWCARPTAVRHAPPLNCWPPG